MIAFSIFLLAVLLLPLAADGNKAEAAAPAGTEKQLTSEEKFAYTTKKEAASGDAAAQYLLGLMYDNGDGVPKDAAKAVEWFQKAAAQGHGDAQYNLGVMYVEGDGVTKDYAKAAEWFQKSSLQGNVPAQASLGWMYYNGAGISKDISLAFDLFKKASEHGEALAQRGLGQMYKLGDGVPKNAVKAMEWYVKAADQGNAQAQQSIGYLYLRGEGVTKDIAKATEWFDKSGTNGDATFKFSLGSSYYYGSAEVPKNPVKAFEWYLKAAEGGHLISYPMVGQMYDNGEGVPKDNAKAFEWYQKAAALGDADAQNMLGYKFYIGEGISKNDVLAYAWSNLAAAQKSNYQIDFDPDGKYEELNAQMASFADDQEKNRAVQRDAYEGLLTPAQRAEGQRLASNWKKGDILIASRTSTGRGARLGSSNGKKGNTLIASGNSSSGTATPNDKPSKQSTGTAFAVSSKGHALTNHHVINGCAEVKIAGREGIAKVITSGSVNDLALLQLPGKTKDVASLNPDLGKLRQGEDIIVFGYPLDSVLSSGGNLTPGTLSALTGLGNNTSQIQITAPIQPGSSGSPVILKTAVERYQPFDTPAVRATQGERLLTKTVTTPFVLSALRSKAYRSMNGVATAFSG